MSRVLGVLTNAWLFLLDPNPNSWSVFSVAVCRFSNTGEDWYVLVGVAKDLILSPRSVAGGFVYTYKLVNNGEKLEFLHKVRTNFQFPWILDLTRFSHLCTKLLGQVFSYFCVRAFYETVSLKVLAMNLAIWIRLAAFEVLVLHHAGLVFYRPAC